MNVKVMILFTVNHGEMDYEKCEDKSGERF